MAAAAPKEFTRELVRSSFIDPHGKERERSPFGTHATVMWVNGAPSITVHGKILSFALQEKDSAEAAKKADGSSRQILILLEESDPILAVLESWNIELHEGMYLVLQHAPKLRAALGISSKVLEKREEALVKIELAVNSRIKPRGEVKEDGKQNLPSIGGTIVHKGSQVTRVYEPYVVDGEDVDMSSIVEVPAEVYLNLPQKMIPCTIVLQPQGIVFQDVQKHAALRLKINSIKFDVPVDKLAMNEETEKTFGGVEYKIVKRPAASGTSGVPKPSGFSGSSGATGLVPTEAPSNPPPMTLDGVDFGSY